MKKFARSPGFYVLVALVVLLSMGAVVNRRSDVEKLSSQEFYKLVESGKVVREPAPVVQDRSDVVTGRFWTGAIPKELNGEKALDKDAVKLVKDFEKKTKPFKVTYAKADDEKIIEALRINDVPYKVNKEGQSLWVSLLFNFLPILLMIGLFMWIINSTQGGGSRIMQFGKARTKTIAKDQPKTMFSDVAGCDEAIEELSEIKEFLENPAKFAAIGAKIPKGVLLYGPPGTGKTLLAKAVAGEAGVPFLSISGSDFVEMFVGVGASRVRDLFEQAKANAPSIVFVDEIDAVGRQRGAGMGGGHDEREQTLNQMLVEMDGFDTRSGVIMIAATNRPDILDPALLRPGRFDRQIMVDRPDLDGRRGIFAVHSKGKPLGPDIDLDVLARSTPGFTGADIANLLNEAALIAARRNKTVISQSEMEAATDRVIAGPEKKSRVMPEKELWVTAYHEGGHALVGHVLDNCDPIHKVTIIPRGRALGLTIALPTEDKYTQTRSALRDQLAMLLGGRTAEEIIFNEITTGASNDIERATGIARSMVTEFGMSELLGPQQLGEKNGEVFMGRDFGRTPNYSAEVAGQIDNEVRKFIDTAHATAYEIISTHREVLDKFAKSLMEKETLDRKDIEELFGHLPKWTKPADQAKLPEIDRGGPTLTPVPVDERELVGVRRSALAKVRQRLGDAIKGDDDLPSSGLPVGVNPRPRPAT
jgi:cell division protease FtsH